MGKSRIEKIWELVQRGVDGEQSNARDIYQRLTSGQHKEFSYSAGQGKVPFIFHTHSVKPGIGNIYLPYYKEVFIELANYDLWKEVYSIATSVIDRVLGKYNWMANDTSYITIACKSTATINSIQNEVDDQVWHFLMSKGMELPNTMQSKIIPNQK